MSWRPLPPGLLPINLELLRPKAVAAEPATTSKSAALELDLPFKTKTKGGKAKGDGHKGGGKAAKKVAASAGGQHPAAAVSSSKDTAGGGAQPKRRELSVDEMDHKVEWYTCPPPPSCPRRHCLYMFCAWYLVIAF